MVRCISIIYVVLLSWSQTQETTGNLPIKEGEAIVLGFQIFKEAQKFRGLLKLKNCNDNGFDEGGISKLTGLGKLDNQIAELSNWLISITEKQTLAEGMQRIQNIIDYVNHTYNKFIALTQEKTCLAGFKSEKMFENVANESRFNFQRLDELILEMPEIIGDVLRDDQSNQLMCGMMQSIQRTLPQIYDSILITNLKAFALTEVAWSELKNDTEGNTETVNERFKNFKKRIQKLFLKASYVIPKATRVVWRCDPDNFEEGESYSKLQQIFQQIILNVEDTTEKSCAHPECHLLYQKGGKATYQPNSPLARRQNPKLHCDGYVTDCVTADDEFNYCAAPENDDRRYAGMKYYDTFYGESFNETSCSSGYGRVENYARGHHHCVSCLCTCASAKVEVDRYFSLKEVTSNTHQQMVVTGVHLRLKNHVFYIDIREGRLGKNGFIEPGTTKWRSASTEEKVDFKKIIQDYPGEFDVLPPNKEVYAVHWEQKTVLLDEIQDESGDFVLTGLRFAQQKDALKLEIRLSPFQYETGIIRSEHVWRSNEQTVESRNIVKIKHGDNPVKKIPGKKDPVNNNYSNSKRYLIFTTTSREKDFGQFTIPFIDTQKVAPEPPTPLSGAGLYHKGLMMGESGGFLGLKVYQFPVNT